MPKGHRVPTPLAESLVTLRRRRRLTQQVVGDLLGIHQKTISEYERGWNLPSPALIEAWAGALRTDPAPLLRLWLRARVGDHLADLILG